jgi:hypothetical protein
VYALAQFFRKDTIDQPLPFQPRLAGKGVRFQFNIEVRFAAAIGMRARVTMMSRGIIHHLQARRRERSREFCRDAVSI